MGNSTMGAMIYEDSLQQVGKHTIKNEWWQAHGVTVVRLRFDGNHEPVPVSFGDYYRDGSNVVIDSKRDIAEVAKNINGRNHRRFRNECVRARDAGYRLVILVENRDNVHDLADLRSWMNDHCRACNNRRRIGCNPNDGAKCPRHNTRKPIQGARLALAMSTMSERYGVVFEFCKPSESARRICELLGVSYEQDAGSGAETSRARAENTPDTARDEDTRHAARR